ncbi:MAG: hypothetical protein K9J37_11440 [Saprospiraceae bacterium]|nr:hypothetical protein [Saprospiraceae bacterium]MCF8250519.1 hypothetical protein [Saprospiraceae bacterium]MCF8279659.1 hypothetical protein [Bacteroidales bacterium]MCF8312445.1 hypothetical protein [Saprospiraceae bacterium]MCF8440738.1 hypothetical protein [Saprospiraceae bacterium]
MKNRFFPIIALLFLLGSCNNAPSGNNSGQAKIPDNLGGYWVNDAWWQELKNTKSPMKAAEKTGDVAAAIFHQEDSTKWVVDLSYGWHEGQQLTLRTKDGGLQAYDPMNAAVHQYSLTPQPDGSIHLDATVMVRLGDAFTGFNVIASTLVGGKYDLGGKTVVFNPKGTVVGLDDYYRYELLLDYVAEDVHADQIMLSKEGLTPEFYAFKMEGNYLQLFEIDDIGSKDEFKYEIGKLKYDLVKK